MMMTLTRASRIAALVTLCVTPTLAQAQDERVRVSFGAAAAAASGDAHLALNGSVGYRFTDRFWFEADVTGLTDPVDRFSSYPFGGRVGQADPIVGRLMARRLSQRGNASLPFPMPTVPDDFSLRAETDGSTLIGTLGIRYELPARDGRFRPWVAGGLGLARTEEQLSMTPLWLPAASRVTEEVSHTGFAVSAGLGASLRVVKHVSLDADARYFRLSRERNLVRLGGGVSVRF